MSRDNSRPSVPGPHARAVVETLARWGSTIATPPYPLVVHRARGSWVEDPDGNRWLDMSGAGGTSLAGHCHPHVARAIQRQAGELLHIGVAEGYHPKHSQLAERLAGLGAARGPELRAVIAQSGSEAVRAAIDLARNYTERDATIAFVASLHAPDLDAVSMPTSKLIERSGLGPLVSGMHHASFPDPLRQGIEATSNALEDILTILGKVVTPDAVAAMLVEPVQTEGGYIFPPDQFLQALRRLCDQHGMLLIANEIHTGFGRTGRLFGWQHSGVEPDIVVLAGGLAGGLPLGALVARSELVKWPAHSRASTFGANPLSCAAALAMLDLLEDELLERCEVAGETLLEALRSSLADHPHVGEVRGRGLLLAVELVLSRESLEPAPELRDATVQRCFERGLIVRPVGPSSIALTPALTVSDAEIELAVALLSHALHDSKGPLPNVAAAADSAWSTQGADVRPSDSLGPPSSPRLTGRPSTAPLAVAVTGSADATMDRPAPKTVSTTAKKAAPAPKKAKPAPKKAAPAPKKAAPAPKKAKPAPKKAKPAPKKAAPAPKKAAPAPKKAKPAAKTARRR